MDNYPDRTKPNSNQRTYNITHTLQYRQHIRTYTTHESNITIRQKRARTTDIDTENHKCTVGVLHLALNNHTKTRLAERLIIPHEEGRIFERAFAALYHPSTQKRRTYIDQHSTSHTHNSKQQSKASRSEEHRAGNKKSYRRRKRRKEGTTHRTNKTPPTPPSPQRLHPLLSRPNRPPTPLTLRAPQPHMTRLAVRIAIMHREADVVVFEGAVACEC